MRAKKRATILAIPGQKQHSTTIKHTLCTTTAHSHHPHDRHSPLPNCLLLPLSVAIRHCPLLSAAVHRCPLPSPAASSHVCLHPLLILPPSACNTSTPIFHRLPPSPLPPPCKVSLWLPMSACLFYFIATRQQQREGNKVSLVPRCPRCTSYYWLRRRQ